MTKFTKILILLCVLYIAMQIVRTWGFWEANNLYEFDSRNNCELEYVYEPSLLIYENDIESQNSIQITNHQSEVVEGVTDIEVIEEIIYYDIPLSYDLQDYTNDLCVEYNFPIEIIYSIMYIESSFRTDIISITNDYGIMQINKINHEWLREEYGVDDFLNPKQNILCGVIMISNLYEKYEDIHKALMAYNCGERGAKRLWNKGCYTSNYSKKIIEYADELILNIKN